MRAGLLLRDFDHWLQHFIKLQLFCNILFVVVCCCCCRRANSVLPANVAAKRSEAMQRASKQKVSNKNNKNKKSIAKIKNSPRLQSSTNSFHFCELQAANSSSWLATSNNKRAWQPHCDLVKSTCQAGICVTAAAAPSFKCAGMQ